MNSIALARATRVVLRQQRSPFSSSSVTKHVAQAAGDKSAPAMTNSANPLQDPAAEQREARASLAARVELEKSLKHNPHGNFGAVQRSRPDFQLGGPGFTYTKTPKADWQFGQGGNDGGASLEKNHVEIDPYEKGRPAGLNYKLLISGVVPRPIGFLSTVGKDGESSNLAPFSFMNVVCYDPPLFTVGFSGGGVADAKDTLKNLCETGEAVLNIISEHFVEAANACSINAPYGVNEWDISGLHRAPSRLVKPPRVKEAIFSVEVKLESIKEFESRDPAKPGKKSGALAILEGVNFWVREDAINEERSIIDPAVLRAVSRLGGITYGRTTEGYEILRPNFDDAVKSGHVSYQ